MLLPKNKPRRDKRHLEFIRSLPCCVCRIEGKTEAAHIRNNGDGGMGMKPSDSRVLPLCCDCHRAQHVEGEPRYWGYKLEAAKDLANALFILTGDAQAARLRIARFR